MNGWVALARACAKSERTPLEQMIRLGQQVLTSHNVPRGKVYVLNPDALQELLRVPDEWIDYPSPDAALNAAFARRSGRLPDGTVNPW